MSLCLPTGSNHASKNECPMRYDESYWFIWWVILSHTESWQVIWLQFISINATMLNGSLCRRRRNCIYRPACCRRWKIVIIFVINPPVGPPAGGGGQVQTHSVLSAFAPPSVLGSPRYRSHILNWFLVTISHFNELRKSFQMLYWKLKSIEIWPRYREKQFCTFFIFRASHHKWSKTMTEQYCHFVHHVADVS